MARVYLETSFVSAYVTDRNSCGERVSADYEE